MDVLSLLCCEKCNMKFESRDMLAMHMIDHSYKADDGQTEEVERLKFKALSPADSLEMSRRGLMARMTSSLHQLVSANMHELLLGHNATESKCEICQRVFSDQDALAMHTLSHANDKKTYQKPVRTAGFSCVYCGMVFSYEDMLILHIVSRHKHMNGGKFPLDLSTKTISGRKRSYEGVPALKNLGTASARSRSCDPTRLPTKSSQLPTTIFASNLNPVQLTNSIMSNLDRSELDQKFTKKIRTSTTFSPCTSQPFKTEPICSAMSDQEHKPIRAASSFSLPTPPAPALSPPDSARTPSSMHSVSPCLPLPNPVKCTSKQTEVTGYSNTTSPSMNSKGAVTSNVDASDKGNSNCKEPEEELSPVPALQRLLADTKDVFLCVHCNIIFLDRAMYHLHTGLHNHNSPLQCNICGKECSNPLEFSAHVIHT